MRRWLSVSVIRGAKRVGRERSLACPVGLILILAGLPTQGRAGLIIDPVFDSSVTSLPNAAQVELAFNYAAGQIEALFSNPITLTIGVSMNPTGVVDAYNQSILYGPDGPIQNIGPNTYFTYSQVVQGLSSNVTSAADASAIANLPATDPTNGGGFALVSAQLKLWGLTSALAGTNYPDGYITFNGDPSLYAFDPNNRAVPGEYDFIGIAEHEITHAMGRVSLAGGSPFDLFRYSSPGVLDITSLIYPAYFSIDGGITNLRTFGSPDAADWDSSQPNDPFDASATAGVQAAISTADITVMNVLGYQSVSAAPEPAGWTLMGLGLTLLFACGKRLIPR